jgi:LPPG:FO 2-phospho-L-lactate transferase
MKIVALAGGVGGAKLADGLSQCVSPQDLTLVVNTGDDFLHWGLNISPDLDTVCYTLAGIANPDTGWGRKDESWEVYTSISEIGGDDWFRIGDKDLATHLERTKRLKHGKSLSQITNQFCASWKVAAKVLPMSDQPVPTMVDTVEQGEIAFQEYFVHQHCEPTVRKFRFAGIEVAQPAPGVLDAIYSADAIIICPSNPWVSIDPILAIPGIKTAIQKKKVVAVSPIIAGQTIKGPAAKMFREMGFDASSVAVAKHYGNLISGFVLDEQDRIHQSELSSSNIHVLVTNTIMKNFKDRFQLAKDVLNFIEVS